MELRSAETEIISNVQDFVDKIRPERESRKASMAESRPRVMAQPVRRQPAAAAADPGLSMAGAQRVPAASKLSQKQSLFDAGGGRSDSAPFGATPVRLLGSNAPILGTQEAGAPAQAPVESRTMVLAQAPAAYPEIDRIIERSWSLRPLSKGEAQALYAALFDARSRVMDPENRNLGCSRSLMTSSRSDSIAVSELLRRISEAVQTMKPDEMFEPKKEELASAEMYLECAASIPKPSSNIGAWLILGAAAAGLVYLLLPASMPAKKKK